MTYLCDKKREVEGDIDEEKGSTKRFKSQGNIEYGNQKQFEPIITHSSQLAPSYQYPPHQYQYYPHQYPPYQQQYPLHYQYYNQNQQHFFDSSSQNQQYLPQFHQYHQPYLIPLLKVKYNNIPCNQHHHHNNHNKTFNIHHQNHNNPLHN